jgi:hypothetical protein
MRRSLQWRLETLRDSKEGSSFHHSSNYLSEGSQQASIIKSFLYPNTDNQNASIQATKPPTPIVVAIPKSARYVTTPTIAPAPPASPSTSERAKNHRREWRFSSGRSRVATVADSCACVASEAPWDSRLS